MPAYETLFLVGDTWAVPAHVYLCKSCLMNFAHIYRLRGGPRRYYVLLDECRHMVRLDRA